MCKHFTKTVRWTVNINRQWEILRLTFTSTHSKQNTVNYENLQTSVCESNHRNCQNAEYRIRNIVYRDSSCTANAY